MDTEMDLREIFLIIKQKILLILVSTVAFALAAFLISSVVITPLYSASASMYVYNEDKRTSDTITSTDLTTSQQLVQTYIVILTSNTVLDQVSDKLDNVYSTKQLREMISASAINDTEAFKITVTNADPAVAQKVANTVANVAPDEIIRVVKAGAVEVIDYATLPEEPSSPNTMRNTAVGALLGLVLACLTAIVTAMFDTAVRCEEDLTTHFNLPVLGVIPSLMTKEEEGGHHKYEYQARKQA